MAIGGLANRFGTADHQRPERANGESRLMEAGVGINWLLAGTIAAFVSATAAAASAVCSAIALRSQARAVDVSSYLARISRMSRMSGDAVARFC